MWSWLAAFVCGIFVLAAAPSGADCAEAGRLHRQTCIVNETSGTLPSKKIQPGGEEALAKTSEIQSVSLETAVRDGKVRAVLSGDGKTTSHCQLSLTNLTGCPQRISIPQYQSFLPDKSGYQIMMTTESQSVELPAVQTDAIAENTTIETICSSPKSAKAPPADGVSYTASNYPNLQLRSVIISLFETSKVLDKLNCYRNIPIPETARQHTIGQLSVWRAFSQITREPADEISPFSLREDLFKRSNVDPKMLTAPEKKFADDKVCAMFAAVDFTVKQTPSAAPYVVAHSPTATRPAADSKILVFCHPTDEMAQVPAPQQTDPPKNPNADVTDKALEDWEEALIKELMDEMNEDADPPPAGIKDPSNFDHLSKLTPDEMDSELRLLGDEMYDALMARKDEETILKAEPREFEKWKKEKLRLLYVRKDSFDEHLEQGDNKIRQLLSEIRAASTKAAQPNKNPLRKLKAEAKKWISSNCQLFLQKWALLDEIHRVENLKQS
jgi:hypothetical protein